MPATNLRCRACDAVYPLDGIGTCTQCFGPLDPQYDFETLEVTRESIAAGPPSIWRYAALLPVEPPAEARLAPGLTPLVAAPRLAEELGIGELYLKLTFSVSKGSVTCGREDFDGYRNAWKTLPALAAPEPEASAAGAGSAEVGPQA